jgi:hypothetical protein|nr:MAG TPA: protein of unknown function (UPF0242) [Caudoviricetes sp.]
MGIFIERRDHWGKFLLNLLLIFHYAAPLMFLTFLCCEYDAFTWIDFILGILIYVVINALLNLRIKKFNYRDDKI